MDWRDVVKDPEYFLALTILLGLTPEEVDKIIKASRISVDLEAEEEKEA